MSSGLPVRKVEVNAETQEFWDATTRQTLLLRRCDACAAVIWYPRAFCPMCQSMETSWFASSGRGSVYSFSITRKGSGAWAAAAPYVIAYVELEEGPRVLTNIVGCAVDEVHVGMAVTVAFDPVIDETGTETMAMYRFGPA